MLQLPLLFSIVANEKGAFGSPSTTITKFLGMVLMYFLIRLLWHFLRSQYHQRTIVFDFLSNVNTALPFFFFSDTLCLTGLVHLLSVNVIKYQGKIFGLYCCLMIFLTYSELSESEKLWIDYFKIYYNFVQRICLTAGRISWRRKVL